MNISDVGPSTTLFPRHPVFIVDDEAEIRKSIRIALILSGITNLFECADGNEARDQVQYRPFSVVLLDLVMPGFSGVHLFQHIRNVRPQTLVIVATGVGDPKLARHFLEAGAFDHLTKPIDRISLVSTARRAIQKWEAGPK